MIGERFEHNGRTYEVWHTEPIDGKTLTQILKTKEGRRDLAALAPSDQPFDGWRVYCKGTSVLVERVQSNG